MTLLFSPCPRQRTPPNRSRHLTWASSDEEGYLIRYPDGRLSPLHHLGGLASGEENKSTIVSYFFFFGEALLFLTDYCESPRSCSLCFESRFVFVSSIHWDINFDFIIFRQPCTSEHKSRTTQSGQMRLTCNPNHTGAWAIEMKEIFV